MKSKNQECYLAPQYVEHQMRYINDAIQLAKDSGQNQFVFYGLQSLVNQLSVKLRQFGFVVSDPIGQMIVIFFDEYSAALAMVRHGYTFGDHRFDQNLIRQYEESEAENQSILRKLEL